MKSTALGFYGKLPQNGDFITRNLGQAFIQPWDAWLQQALFTSQQQLGINWLQRYLTSPIWRFVLSAGVCGDSAWAGILMPSVDKVGRYFPLTIAVPLDNIQDLADIFLFNHQWFMQLETVALIGLEGKVSIAEFEKSLLTIPSFSLATSQNSESFLGLKAYLANCQAGYSLWTTADSQAADIKLIAYQSLPPVTLFSDFLDAQSVHHAEVFMPTFPIFAPNITWHSWGVTDQGKRRKHNEDALLSKSDMGLWAIADGMGGYEAGDVASQLIVDSLEKCVLAADFAQQVTEVQNCLQAVNTQLRALAKTQSETSVIGSTVVVLLARANRCAFFWAGDSRLYRLRGNKLQQLTQDHCLTEEHDLQGWAVKKNNVITRAVGADDTLILDCEFSDIEAGDIFLLCSDGLDKEVSFNEIEQIMLTYPHEEIATTLLEMTLQRGARDNVSIIVAVAC